MTAASQTPMNVAVIGAGYVGLVSAACFSAAGHNVTCVDADADRVALLLSGEMPIFEPGLAELVAAGMRSARLSFSGDIAACVADAAIAIIAVGTPQGPDGDADLSHIFEAADAVGRALRRRTVIAIKSTVPVGTGDAVEAIVARAATGCDFAVVSNPEFLREGDAIRDFTRPDRIVIGAAQLWAQAEMTALYRAAVPADVPICIVSRAAAELAKYAANTFLAAKVVFVNEIADLCEATGADIAGVARCMGLDPRIGASFLEAGPGFGGSCFPKDLAALRHTAGRRKVALTLVEATLASNEARRARMAHKIVEACGGSVRGARIAVLGLTFKAGTDDMREAPSIGIIRALRESGANICAYDPHGMPAAARILSEVEFCRDPYAACAGADAAVILTEWPQFRAIDLGRLRETMRRRVLVDLRNLLNPAYAASHGFAYVSIGRRDVAPAAPLLQAAE